MGSRGKLAGLVLLVAMMLALVWGWGHLHPWPSSEPPLAYAGSSEGLRATVVVPTLDTTIDPARNAIWCASFQLAWNALKAETNTPVLPIQNAEEVSMRLDASPLTQADLPPDSALAIAGRTQEGVMEDIATQMQAQFPGFPTEEWHIPVEPEDVYVAFAALVVNTRFAAPYHQHTDPLEFLTGDGGSGGVRAFGIRPKDANRDLELRKQVAVLLEEYAEGRDYGELTGFALDLSVGQEVQVLVAMIPPEARLADFLESLDRKMAEYAARESFEYTRTFQQTDSFLVPEMNWRISHRFHELEGPDKPFLAGDATGMWIRIASQSIALTFDRHGARLRSSAAMMVLSISRHYHANRPFLLVLRERSASQPFFVMWVANGELLNGF